MIETYLPIADLVFTPPACHIDEQLQLGRREQIDAGRERLAQLVGRFSFARQDGNRVSLSRDKLGLNKLFFGLRSNGRVVVANYLIDLLGAGVDFEAVHSAPAGVTVHIDLTRGSPTHEHFYRLPRVAGSEYLPGDLIDLTGRHLTNVLDQLPVTFPESRFVLCLSGGLDSSLIAALAAERLPSLTAYTYTLDDGTGALSDDAMAAQRVARYLRLAIRLVTAGRQRILDAVGPAICHGQDWRDFNVHAAIVNEILAEAIADDSAGQHTVVLTGDLMNEFLGDYSAVLYKGMTIYPLPELPADQLRIALVRGLQAGDREVGVFGWRRLVVVQPYAAASEALLQLASAFPKAELVRTIAGKALPEEIYRRPKVRAQVGDHDARRGVIPILHDAGVDERWLERTFRKTFQITDPRTARRFIRAGMYRPYPEHRRHA